MTSLLVLIRELTTFGGDKKEKNRFRKKKKEAVKCAMRRGVVSRPAPVSPFRTESLPVRKLETVPCPSQRAKTPRTAGLPMEKNANTVTQVMQRVDGKKCDAQKRLLPGNANKVLTRIKTEGSSLAALSEEWPGLPFRATRRKKRKGERERKRGSTHTKWNNKAIFFIPKVNHKAKTNQKQETSSSASRRVMLCGKYGNGQGARSAVVTTATESS